jgi:hypothetical protein
MVEWWNDARLPARQGMVEDHCGIIRRFYSVWLSAVFFSFLKNMAG